MDEKRAIEVSYSPDDLKAQGGRLPPVQIEYDGRQYEVEATVFDITGWEENS